MDAIDRGSPAGVVGGIGRQPQARAKRVAHMGLKRGDRLLFPPGAAKEVVIIRVEPYSSIARPVAATKGGYPVAVRI